MVPAVILTDAVGTYPTNLRQPPDSPLAQMKAHRLIVLVAVRT